MEHRSVWHATSVETDFPRLVGAVDVDVVVVGGGITGLTTALLAQREGARVAGTTEVVDRVESSV